MKVHDHSNLMPCGPQCCAKVRDEDYAVWCHSRLDLDAQADIILRSAGESPQAVAYTAIPGGHEDLISSILAHLDMLTE